MLFNEMVHEICGSRKRMTETERTDARMHVDSRCLRNNRVRVVRKHSDSCLVVRFSANWWLTCQFLWNLLSPQLTLIFSFFNKKPFPFSLPVKYWEKKKNDILLPLFWSLSPKSFLKKTHAIKIITLIFEFWMYFY